MPVIKHLKTAYLALGSNLGNRAANLEAARDAMGLKTRLMAASPLYETAPWGYASQPDFLNQVVRIETKLPPIELLAFLKSIESNLGRKTSFRFGPRLIDLDILSYENLVLELPGLTIPHPRIVERAFVLVPLADLAPDWIHPQSGQAISQLLQAVDRSGIQAYNPTTNP